MPGNPTPPTPDPPQDDRLESWKEIAAYLRREVRTVQRWEKREGLPVHRHVHDKLGSVYAFKSELDAWAVGRRAVVESEEVAADENGAEEFDSTAPEASATSEAPLAAEPSPVPVPKPSLKPKELVRHPVKSLRRPVGVPLGILLVIIAVTVYLIWPRTKIEGNRLKIAVLPFDNLSGDAEQEYLSDGLTEELISQMSRLNPDSLLVIARQTSMQQKGSKKTLREIGKDLSVDYIVNGSVRLSKGDPASPADDRMRITANLSQVSTNSQRWSENYNRQLSDILSVESEVAQSIAQAIGLILTPQQRARLASPAPVNSEAYQNYLKGRYQLNRRDLASMQHGLDYFGRAVASDPGFALAYVGIADTYDLLGFYSALPPGQAYPEAKKAAQKALALDDSLAEAYTTLADVQLHFDYDWKSAEQGFRSAIQRNANYPVAHHWLAVLLSLSGRAAESRTEIEHAHKLDPASLAISGDMALHYYYAGEFDQTIAQGKACLELDPNYHMCHFWLGRAYVEKKMYVEAINEIRRAIELQPENLMAVALLGHAYARSGQPAKARETIRNLQRLSTRRYVSPSLFAIVYCGLGEIDSAFEWIARAFQQRDPLLTRMKLDPVTVPLRSDPRFADLLRRVGLQP
ncbi:MAG: tetratricopeptide repeat protein [Acidobacteria bacterium]|nr:tetratricopeptide repeat protein [Acidobacteriota bacterium]MCL5288157.1 tetratricopeptide repeat protein [Acidobacteriota bacterium]